MKFLILVILIPPTIEDIKSREIRNVYWILIFLIRSIQLIVEMDSELIVSSLIGLAVVTLIVMITFIINKEGIGTGDIKLLISLGFASGFKLLVSELFYISLCSLLFALFLLATKKANKKTELPFVPFIFAGTLIATLVEVIS